MILHSEATIMSVSLHFPLSEDIPAFTQDHPPLAQAIEVCTIMTLTKDMAHQVMSWIRLSGDGEHFLN